MQYDVHGQIELELAEPTVAVSVAENPDAGEHLVGECSSACLLQARLRTHGTNKACLVVRTEIRLVKRDVFRGRKGECCVGNRVGHRLSRWDARAAKWRSSRHHSGWDNRAAEWRSLHRHPQPCSARADVHRRGLPAGNSLPLAVADM